MGLPVPSVGTFSQVSRPTTREAPERLLPLIAAGDAGWQVRPDKIFIERPLGQAAHKARTNRQRRSFRHSNDESGAA